VVLFDFANKQTTNKLSNSNPDISKLSALRKDSFSSAKKVAKLHLLSFNQNIYKPVI
jgi:hypothetical protein